jgi:hypothetical protein
MRAARFIARYNLALDDEIVNEVKEMQGPLEIVSAQWIRDELESSSSSTVPHPACSTSWTPA